MNWSLLFTNSVLTAVITVILTWLAKPYFVGYLQKKGEQRAVLEDLEKLNRKMENLRSEFVERNSYLAEKGKSAATKEDIEEISRKIESIRTEYAQTLEILKWQLSKSATIHRLRIEKEIDVLSRIWEAAAELRFATQELRPILEYVDPSETDAQRWQRKLQSFGKSYTELVNAIEKHRPFYAATIYTKLDRLLGAAKKEMIDCRTALALGDGHISGREYERAQENMQNLLQFVNDICETVRGRLNDADRT
jgi:archaellum component FlaC